MTLTVCEHQPIGMNVWYASACGRFLFKEIWRQHGWGSLIHKPSGRFRTVKSLAAAEAEADRWAEELEREGT